MVDSPALPTRSGVTSVGLGRWVIWDGLNWAAADFGMQVYQPPLAPTPHIADEEWPGQRLGNGLHGYWYMPDVAAYQSAPGGFFDVLVEGGRSYDEGGSLWFPPTSPPVFTGGSVDTAPPGWVPPVCPDDGLLLLSNSVVVSGTSEPYALIKVYMDDPGPLVGQMVGSSQADASGLWSVQLQVVLPEGRRCVTATATVGTETSKTSESWCFAVGVCDGAAPPPTRTVDTVSSGSGYSTGSGWDGFPVYHGYYSSLAGGKLRGFVWLPGLGQVYTCTKVEVQWFAEHMFAPTGGKISFGYHSLPWPPPGGVDYADPRLVENVVEHPFAAGETRWVELPGFAEYVNRYRYEGFGFFVGHDSYSSANYGYGSPVAVRYTWTQEEGWLR